jgi:hypothetical protein
MYDKADPFPRDAAKALGNSTERAEMQTTLLSAPILYDAAKLTYGVLWHTSDKSSEIM